MRCFVAVDIDNGLKDRIIAFQKSLPEIDAKIVEKENLHFTLKFLGEINEKTLEQAKKILSRVASQFAPFSASVRGMGTFPNISYIRVVWLGCPELYNLQKAVDEALSPLFKKERGVNPHLTLARVRSQKNEHLLAEFINKNKDIEIGYFMVKEIKLKKSTLTAKGPIYEDVGGFDLYHQKKQP